VWTGIERGRTELIETEREVAARLATLGIPPERRPYSPHLTLARIRDAAGLRSTRLLDGFADRPVGTTRIDAITLFQSTLSPRGAVYVPLVRTPLARS
jgi:2'-5' RNA ligase